MAGRYFCILKYRKKKFSCDDFGNLGCEALPKSVAVCFLNCDKEVLIDGR